MSTAPQPPRPPIKGESLTKKEKKQSWHEKKEQRQKYWVTTFLAFVFGVTSVAFFASNPFSGVPQPNESKQATTNEPPGQAELKSLNDQIAADPKNPANYFRLGEELYKQQKWPEAAAAYQKTLDLDPKDVMAMSHLGTVLIQQDKLPEAVAMLEKAEALENEQVAARKAKGEEGDIEDINIPERLYEAYVLTGHKDKAEAEIERAKDIDLQHVAQQFLLVNSEKYFMEKDKKDVAQQFMDDGSRLSAKINPKLKEGFYNELVFESWFGAMQDKQHPDRMAKVQAWLDLLAQALMKTDPALGVKLAMELQQLEHPPSPKPSGSASPAASSSAAPASAAPASSAPSSTPQSPTTEAPGPH